jgi:3-oxoacyl-[acyl-carrier protein] reductase
MSPARTSAWTTWRGGAGGGRARAAGRAALRRAGAEPSDLDLVLVGTTTAEELTPNAAPLVAHRLGATAAGAIDVGAACTAFVSALALGAGMIEAGRASRVLVVGADVLSRHTDPFDRRTAALFGDGAGAAVLERVGAPGAIGPAPMGADGTGAPHRARAASVPGASRGIGAATARTLVAERPVGVNYRADAEGAREVVGQIEAAGGSAMALQGDVSAPGGLDSAFAELEERFGPVLVLVNNAGVRADNLALQIGEEDWSRVVETNLSGAFRATRRALRGMLRARFGRVVNIASVVGPRANPGQANYAAAKAGLVGMTRTLAAEVARRGVRVNAVAPGLIETDLVEDVAERMLEAVPARRAGTPEDVAACVAFLASEEAGYVTGATLTVDRGLSA